MSDLITIYNEWTRQVQLPGTISQDEATDILQTFAPTVDDPTGDDWWLAVAVRYNDRGIIAQPTYVALRNHANNNEGGANALFQDLIAAINSLPESEPVLQALALQNAVDSQAEISGNQARIEALKSGGTSVADVQFDQALDVAIEALNGLDVSLTDQINSLSP